LNASGEADFLVGTGRTAQKQEGFVFAAPRKNHAFFSERDRRDRSPIDRSNDTNLSHAFSFSKKSMRKIGAQERTRTSTDCSTGT
jgi:hypothetical protein